MAHSTASSNAPTTPRTRHASIPLDGVTSSSSSQTATQLSELLPSMTPPPSSQPHHRVPSPVLQQMTPKRVSLSSPPQTHVLLVKREMNTTMTYIVPTSTQIDAASADELRELLRASLLEHTRLEAQLGEARMSAAHYKLQHQLLGIETAEDKNRLEVENDLTRREVEVLRMAEQGRESRVSASPQLPSGSARYIEELRACCEALHVDNRELERRLDNAKDIIADREEKLETLSGKNRDLVTRIRENREHLNRGIYGGIYSTPRHTNSSFPSTPQQYRTTPKHAPRSEQHHHRNREDGQDNVAALLLADRVLADRQELHSIPSTPTMPARHVEYYHTPTQQRPGRNVLAMASLPSTPQHSRPMTSDGYLLPSIQFHPQSEPRYPTQPFPRSRPIREQEPAQRHKQEQEQERNRRSRDSTISASDAEEIAAYNRAAAAAALQQVGDTPPNEEVVHDKLQQSRASQASQASQAIYPSQTSKVGHLTRAAIDIQRPDPKDDGEAKKQRTPLVQSRIVGGLVTKPESSASKRKRSGEEAEADAKEVVKGGRTQGVGLGIGIPKF